MEWNTYRDDNGTDQPRTYADQREPYYEDGEPYYEEGEPYLDQPGTYWRRRVATLAVGLGVLGLLAWAFSGGGGKAAPPGPHDSPGSGVMSAAADPSAAASPSTSAGASPTTGADAAVPGLVNQSTSGQPSATSSPTAKSATSAKSVKSTASVKSAKSTASANAAQAAAGTERGGRCPASSVVLSVFSGSRSYPAGQDPQFDVDAVSTAPGTCTFDLSSSQLYLVVMSAGHVIWDSTDCGVSDRTRLSRLTRGIPVQEHFTWNRAITLPGCVTLASAARPGSYQAQARTSAITSRTLSFRLVR